MTQTSGKPSAAASRSRNVAGLMAALMLLVSLAFAPISPAAAATGDPETLTGTVFRDNNFDGLRAISEPGVPGVTITAYCELDGDGDPTTPGVDPIAPTVVTDNNGLYSLAVKEGYDCRVEASGWPDYLEPGPAGAYNDTTVQFVAIPAGGAVAGEVSLINPADYCDTNPFVAMPCFGFGAYDGDHSALDTLAGTLYDSGASSGTTLADYGLGTASHNSTMLETGATYGSAWDRTDNSFYQAAYMKNYSGFGPGGPGAIYVTGLSNAGVTTTPTAEWLDIYDFPGVSQCVDPHGDDLILATGPALVRPAFAAVGRCSMADIELSEDNSTMYVVNLSDANGGEVIAIDVATKTMIGSPWAIPTGEGDCPDPVTDIHPGALAVKDGWVYLGVTCGADSTQDPDDVRHYVYRMDPATGLPSPAAAILNTQTAYGLPAGSIGYRPQAWIDDPDESSSMAADLPTPFYRQLWLTDIGIQNNQVTLAFRDIFPDQAPTRAPNQNGVIQLANGRGDMLCGALNGASITLENAGTCNGNLGTGSDAGPGGAEFFEDGAGNHIENSFGSVVALENQTSVLTTAVNPAEYFGATGGVNYYGAGLFTSDLTDGSPVRAFSMYQSATGGIGANSPTFGKSNGLGDVAALCTPAPVEIGNRLWYDADGDGIQDPGEAPVVGATVNLYAADGTTLIATTVTDANGEYYFSSAGPDGIPLNGDDLFSTGESVVIRVDSPADYGPGGALENWAPTSDSADLDDDADSDGIVAADGYPEIAYTVGEAGENDHTLDFGFTQGYDLALSKVLSSINGAARTVTFDIEVTNQSVAVQTVEVTDYVQTGFVYDPALNSAGTVADSGNGDNFDYTWTGAVGATAPVVNLTPSPATGTLATGESVIIPITLEIDASWNGQELINWAEISNFDNDTDASNGDAASDDLVDIDSTPDQTIGNDVQPTGPGAPGDNVIDGDGDGPDPVENDEDDHDVAGVPILDLALRKILDVENSQLPVAPGSNITFDIEVINQGSVHANNITVYDYVDTTMWEPFDVAVNPATADYSWTAVGTDGEVSLTGVLAPGASKTVSVTLTVAAGAELTGLLNKAEISNSVASDDSGNEITYPDGSTVPDIDSVADQNDDDPQPGAPGDPTDNAVDNEVDAAGVADEDDHDIAGVEAPTYSLGNQVWFDENNNGIKDAGETPIEAIWVELFTDNDGDGLPDDTNGDGVITSDDAVAETSTDADGLYLFDGLEPGVYIVGIPPMEWEEGGPLYGMLSSDPTSTNPDDDVDNDDNGTPCLCVDGYVYSGPVTLEGGEPTSEDPDNDPNTPDANENLTVDFGFWRPQFDLALRKQLADGTNSAEVDAGDTVTFNLEVFNQGNVDALDATIIDYIPAGLILSDDNWTLLPDGSAIFTLSGVTIPAGESVLVTIDFVVSEDAEPGIVNTAEIASAFPVDPDGKVIFMPNGVLLPDVDSAADVNNLDEVSDDVLDNADGDEDDHDVAELNIGTLAFTGLSSLRLLTLALFLAFAGSTLVARQRQRCRVVAK